MEKCGDFVQNETQVIQVTYFGKQMYLLSDTQPFLMFLTDNTLHLFLKIFKRKSGGDMTGRKMRAL